MFVLQNVRKLYDGSGTGPDSIHENVDVVVQNGRVHSITPHGTTPNDPDAPVIDAAAWTVTPGLIDCHSHITVLGLGGQDMDRMNSHLAPLFVEKVLYRTLVDGGVTTLRDVGGATHWMKRMVDEGIMIGPRLKISICMLSTTGGHADFRGPDRCHAEISRLWPPGPGRPSSIVDGPWECRQRVREIAACGADLIKICSSPGVASPSDHLEHREFTAEEVQAITDEAKHRGLKVAAHAHSRSGLKLGIDHGVSDLQHISFMDAELVETAAEHGCSVTPTSWIIQELLTAPGLDPFVMEKVKKVAECHQTAVQAARDGGLPILAGTDPVLPGMHGRNGMEIVHLVRDGLSSLQAWHGMTGLAATEIGQDDTGTLKAGQRADLLIWNDDVLNDPESLAKGPPHEVIQDGLGHRNAVTSIPQRDFESTVAAGLPSADS